MIGVSDDKPRVPRIPEGERCHVGTPGHGTVLHNLLILVDFPWDVNKSELSEGSVMYALSDPLGASANSAALLLSFVLFLVY